VATPLEKLGNLRLVREKSGKMCSCMCLITLTQNMHEKSSLVGKVLHIEHSCRSYARIFEYCNEKYTVTGISFCIATVRRVDTA